MAFIKNGDGKILGIIDQEALSDEQKELVEEDCEDQESSKSKKLAKSKRKSA